MDLSNVSIAVPITVALFFAGLYIILKRGNIKVTRDGLTASQAQLKPEPLMPLKYAQLMVEVTEASGNHRDALRDIQMSTIEEQMRRFEEAELAIYATFKKAFAVITKDLPVEVARRESRAFTHMLRTVVADVKVQIRKWFKTNHYNELNDAEWAAYVAQKKQTLRHIVTEAFDTEWISDVIDRQELYRLDALEHEAIDDIIESTFNQARQVSIRRYADSQEEKARWTGYTMRIAGYDPYACD